MRTNSLSPSALLIALAASAACATGSSSRADRQGCALVAADSVHLSGGPVYRDCQVDREARRDARSGTIEFSSISVPTVGGVRCMEAEIELVVGTDGRPEQGTWRLVRSNVPAFGDAVLEAVPSWRYEPALLDGVPVRQIVREERKAAIVVTQVPAGSMRGPPAPPRC